MPSQPPPPDRPSAAGSNTPRRSQSVRFSAPTSPNHMSPTASPPRDTPQQHPAVEEAGTSSTAPESSGDEITPIVQRERGLSRGKKYDGSGESASGSGAATPASGRRRKGGRKTSGADGEEEEHGDGEGEDDSTGGAGGVGAWLRSVAEKYGSVELDNKGSVARDHLALERTFLAWLRTSLAFASIGIAITQLFRLNTAISPDPPSLHQPFHLAQVGKPLGATFLAIAILVLILGGRRYFESQYWIVRGKFPASRGSVMLITAVAIGVIVGSLVLVIVVDPGVFEKRR